MVKERANIFDETPALDVSGFKPKRSHVDAPSKAQVKAVTETTEFKSREAAPAPIQTPDTKRPPRVHRTGRNVQFNIKASSETIDEFYAITDAHPGWVLGYTLDRAVAALKRELEAIDAKEV